MQEYITPVLTLLGIIIGVVAGRRMRISEAKKVDADAGSVEVATASKVQDIYRGIVDDLALKVSQLSAEQVVMKASHTLAVDTLNASIADLKKLVSEQQVTIGSLTNEQTAMKSSHNMIVETLNTNITDLQKLIGEQNVTIAGLRDEITKLNKFINDLREQITEMGQVPVKKE